MMKQEEMLYKFENPNFISSLILEEIKSNQLDSITVICQDGERIEVSSTLLAALSPFLARLLKPLEQEECVLYVPEVEANIITNLIKYVFTKGMIPSIFTDCVSIGQLDGIFWKLDNIIKQESLEDLVGDDFDVSSYMNFELKQEEKKDSIKTVTESNPVATKKRKRKKSPVPKSSKRKIKDEDFSMEETNHVEIDSDAESITGEKDPDFFVDKKKSTEEKKRRPGKPLKKPRSKSKKVYDDGNNDEGFELAQRSLRIDLEDIRNLEDPGLLWFKYHELNPLIHYLRHQNKIVKLICPICSEVFPPVFGGKKFLHHIRSHKYSSYICPCKPKAGKEARYHLQLEHWKWIKCELCPHAIQPEQLPFHMFTKHKWKKLECKDCHKSLNTCAKYWAHMDLHQTNNIMCSYGCVNVTFKNFIHRKHHIQVYHKKEKLGCDKCYFLCSTAEELTDHIQKKHAEKEKYVRKTKRIVCDICGKEMSSASLKDHKEMAHDPVLIQCNQCPGKYTAAALKRHIRVCHSEGFCNICGIKVKMLVRHMNVMHSSEKNSKHKCEHCPKVFHYKHQLTNHTMSVHLKERPYKCRYGCDIAYNDSSNRNAHERRRHGQRFTSAVLNKVAEDC
eukprot:TRINITY_DN12710_c0_g1_i1.p1 TRINITY_DN12710_c0_g1~~TRINITY_DN12710_c0_g1_i1.p1  ORF type:complete len:618 (+),score=103.32 TRINITY_DN12710_c0_g1_i1:38-1891(+)